MKLVPNKLTAVIRDMRLLDINEPCSYRRVTIELTPEQQAALTMSYFGVSGGINSYEEVSNAFLEFPEEAK